VSSDDDQGPAVPEELERQKPKWLRRLERESWQAELIISGAAIFGSLQLPGLLAQAEHYLLLNLNRDTLFICYIAIIYWRILVSGLIVLFIFHFIVRALWIGLVGLNSVYPGGFRANKRFAEHYQERMRQEYGDIDGFIVKLDRLGSGIFGVGFGIAGVFLNFGILGVVFIILHGLLMGQDLSPATILLLFGGILVPILIVSLISMAMHTKRLRDTRLARRYLWPVTNMMSRITYPLSRRYIITSNNLITSYYADSKAFVWWFLAAMILMIVMGSASVIGNENIPFFIDGVYHRMADDSTRLGEESRLDGDYEGIYYRPLIPADEDLSAASLPVWIPLPEREYIFLDRLCSIPAIPDSLERSERVGKRRQRQLDCARQYLSIRLNGKLQQGYSLKREYRTNESGEQYGVRATLAAPPLLHGENMLEITTAYPHEEDGRPRRTYTPFYYFEQ